MKSPIGPEYYVKQSYHEPDNFDPFRGGTRGRSDQDSAGGNFIQDDLGRALDKIRRLALKKGGAAQPGPSFEEEEPVASPGESFSVITPSTSSMFSRPTAPSPSFATHKAAVNEFEQDPARWCRCYVCGQLCVFVTTGQREFTDPPVPDGYWEHQD